MATYNNPAGSVLGKPVLGVITILDKRPFGSSQGGNLSPSNKTKGTVGIAPGGDTNNQRMTAGLTSIPVPPSLETPGAPGGQAAGGVKKMIEVQFNPSQITIQAQGGGAAQITNFGGNTKDGEVGSNSISYTKLEPRITVNIPLIFDSVVNADAFFADKILTNPTSVAKNAVSAVANGFGYEQTVQTQVEGLIGALRNEYTRGIIFSWSDMSFSGVLNGINSQYTMFSPTGKPIRATVNLTILCSDTELARGHMGQWTEKYKEAFIRKGDVIQNQTASQKVSSLINLG